MNPSRTVALLVPGGITSKEHRVLNARLGMRTAHPESILCLAGLITLFWEVEEH